MTATATTMATMGATEGSGFATEKQHAFFNLRNRAAELHPDPGDDSVLSVLAVALRRLHAAAEEHRADAGVFFDDSVDPPPGRA